MLLLQCYAPPSFAQPVYHFENLTTANGLSDNRVTCFLKDRSGFMWIGTENGLNRYDGHSFRIYRPGNTGYTISDESINDIEQDHQGNLWVATSKGLNRLDLKNNNTAVYTSDHMPSDLIWDTYADQQNKLWIAPDNRDLCYYDYKTDSFNRVPWIAYVKQNFPNHLNTYKSIQKIYAKSPDELWLGTSIGLFSIQISTGQFTYYESFDVDHFIQLETGAKAVYFTQNPVPAFKCIDQKTKAGKDVYWNTIPTVTPGYQRNSDCNNYRWLPAGKNIVEINTVTGECLLISHIADDPFSLPDGSVRTIYRDNTGLVWVATSNGIGKFNPAMDPFPFTAVLPNFKWTGPEENDIYRLNHPIHTVFYSRQDDKYYIGSPATNSLIIRDRATGRSEVITSIQGIPLRRCSVIYEDSKGMLWILAAQNAFCYDRRNKKFVVTPFRVDKRTTIFADMAEDDEGNIWIASFNDGLYRFNLATGTATRFDEGNGFCNLPTSLYFDKEKKTMLVGTFGYGLFAYDMRAQCFIDIMKKYRRLNYARFSMITDFTKDKYGSLWVASYATGIAKVDAYYDSVQSKIKVITTQDGLPDNNIYALASDHNGNTWASTFQGITQISSMGRITRNYNRWSGLYFTDFYSPFTMTPSGEIVTGINNGFIRFQPDSLPYHAPDFTVVLTAVKPKDPTETKLFAYDNNEIQFEYAALSYLHPTQTRYEYRMEGLDKDWVDADHVTIARYNNLPPGSHTFEVRAIDVTGKRSFNSASFTFTIRPPWWQTWWFRVMAVAMIIGAIYLLFRQRIRSIRNKADIRQQMTELKSRALRAQMNPHFIFNCLNAIQELIVREQYSDSYTYLSKFSKLLRTVLNLSEKNFIPLSSEIELCALYLELESMRFKNTFTWSIQADPGIDTETIFIPNLLLQPFIENAIWHGLLPKVGEKSLSIHFSEQQGRLVCVIRDNGIGRKKAAAIKAQKIGSQHFDSRGMEITRQRIENLHAEGVHDTTIEIKDCEDEAGNATGTLVQISFFSSDK